MAGKPKPDSIRETAKRLAGELGFAVSKRMVEEWKKKGFPLDDREELLRRIRNQERLPRGMRTKAKPTPDPTSAPAPAKGKKAKKETPPAPPTPEENLNAEQVERDLRGLYDDLKKATDYDDTRRIQTQIKGVREVLKELREAGRYILREDANVHAARAALAVRAELEKLEDSLPPLLEGRTALQMKTRIRDYSRGVTIELSKVFQ